MNKVVLVTGSGRGLGKEIAKYFAKNNYEVIINYSSNIISAEETFKEINQISQLNHSIIKSDLSNLSEIEQLFSKITTTYGRLDVLVNNAGSTKFIPHSHLEELTPEIFDYLYQLNLRAPFICSQKARALMQNSSCPSIINISSIAATTANGSNIAYCALKAGLVNMTKSLARALGPQIRVNSVSPGLIETDLTRSWKEYATEQISKTSLKRLASPKDIATVVYNLAGNMNFINGQDIIVDGGRVIN